MRKQSLPQPMVASSSPIGNKFVVKKRSVNALSSRVDTNSKFNAMNSTHMTIASDISASNKISVPKNESMFRATDSSYLIAGSSQSYNTKPHFKVISLSPEEGIQLESQKQLGRLTLYRALIVPTSSTQ